MIGCGRREAWTCAFLPGMRKDSSEPASAAPAPAVGSESQRDGAWHCQKTMESFGNRAAGALGLMSIYLRGGAQAFRFISACTYGAPIPGVCVFAADACSLFILIRALVVRVRCIRQARPSVGMRFYLYIWCIYLFDFHSANLGRQL